MEDSLRVPQAAAVEKYYSEAPVSHTARPIKQARLRRQTLVLLERASSSCALETLEQAFWVPASVMQEV